MQLIKKSANKKANKNFRTLNLIMSDRKQLPNRKMIINSLIKCKNNLFAVQLEHR